VEMNLLHRIPMSLRKGKRYHAKLCYELYFYTIQESIGRGSYCKKNAGYKDR
jgi:hypothetical protein